MRPNRLLKRLFSSLALVSLLLAPLGAPTSAAQGASALSFPPAPSAPFVEGELLVQVAPGASLPEAARSVGASVVRSVGDGSIHLLRVGPGQVPGAVQALRARSDVVFAEPNWLRQLHETPSDSGFDKKWDLNNTGALGGTPDADVDWLEAYNLLGSTFNGSATIAVIDTGVDRNHPDLDNKLVAGYDYLDNDSDPTDTYGHGTHVSGIAAAETNNGIGTAGIAFSPQVKIMPLRVCDQSGCPTDAIVNAIYHAADHGANVINMSLGGRLGSTAEETAINYAWGKGLVIAASAGNDGASKVSYPAAFANAMAVGSTNWNDARASYSNYGSALDIVAPGGEMSYLHDPGGIYSSMPTYDVYLTTTYGYGKNYDQLQGTSMAAPQVSGLAALLFAVGVKDTNGDGRVNDEIRSIIESTADDLGTAGWDRQFGWGRINVNKAVEAALGSTPPPANTPPTVSIANPADGSTVSGTLTVQISASDKEDTGLLSVQWQVDGGALQTATYNATSHYYEASWDTTGVPDGAHTLTATATDSQNASGTATSTVTVANTTPPPTGTMHVGDLDGTSRVVNKNFWSATVTITVHDANEAPVANASVTGTWSGGYKGTGTCVTGSTGQCSLTSGNIRTATSPSVTFTVTNVTQATLTYDADANHDPDGDSTGTAITINK